MAAYFIDYISTYSNTNKKGKKLQQFIIRFKQLLVKDDVGMDALKAEIERETEQPILQVQVLPDSVWHLSKVTVTR